MILGFASALNYLDYFLIIYRDRSHTTIGCDGRLVLRRKR
jgi:hypothetical protein